MDFLQTAGMIAGQVLVLYLLIAVGILCRKKGLINEQTTSQMTSIVLIVVTPCLIISSFQVEFDTELAVGLIISAVSAVLSHLVGIVLSSVVFRRNPDAQKRVLRFGSIYSNCGFMSFPLLSAVLGPTGVFYGSAYVAVFNVMQWTHGLIIMTGDKSQISIKKVLLNPGVIGTAIALPFFFFSIQIPEIPMEAIDSIASLNTPLAMIIIGSHIASSNIKKSLTSRASYAVAAVRLVAVPLVMLLALMLCPISSELRTACLISASAPAAASTVLFAAAHNQDSELASCVVAITTTFSIITMPVMITLSSL